ncbi:MAG: hypothetical protein V3R90_15025, partial [Limibaculum sp.]
ADGQYVYFHWNSPAKLDSLNVLDPESAYDHYVELQDDAGYYVLDVGDKTIAKLEVQAADTLVPAESVWNNARDRCVEIRDGDLYFIDLAEGTTRRVTATLAREGHVQIPNESDVVYFVRNDNVFSLQWNGGPVRQLTNLKLSGEPKEKGESAQREYLVEQQETLFTDFQRDKEDSEPARPEAVFLGSGCSGG